MSWLDFQEFIIKSWVGIFTIFLYPIGRWINQKRKNYELLEKRVEELERQGKEMKEEIANIETKMDNNQIVVCDKLDSIASTLAEVSKDTAVNAAKIEAKK